MGNVESGMVHRKLSKELPGVRNKGPLASSDTGDAIGFDDEGDRDQFICALIAIISQESSSNLWDHDFRLLWTRSELKDSRVKAQVVTIKDNQIKAKIDPQMDGESRAEAFAALRKFVEIQLDRHLKSVPSALKQERAGDRPDVDGPPPYIPK